MLLSVIIPVYKCNTLGTILALVAWALPNVSKEIVIVDDCSKDGTREWLKANFPDGLSSGSTFDLDGNGDLAFTLKGRRLRLSPSVPSTMSAIGVRVLVCRQDSPQPPETSS
jgi:glycosyltransferase involved in cell wall biosynthesis